MGIFRIVEQKGLWPPATQGSVTLAIASIDRLLMFDESLHSTDVLEYQDSLASIEKSTFPGVVIAEGYLTMENDGGLVSRKRGQMEDKGLSRHVWC